MKNSLIQLKQLLLSSATTVSLLALPLVLSIYYFVNLYSQKVITQQNVNYLDIQSDVLAKFFVEQSWLAWIDRAMDFVFWGLLAAVVILLIWAVSAVRTSLYNHKTEESFVNFRVPKNKWNSHFVVMALIKGLLVLVFLATLILLVGRSVPLLGSAVAKVVQLPNKQTYLNLVKDFFFMFLLQYIGISSLKLFKSIQVE